MGRSAPIPTRHAFEKLLPLRWLWARTRSVSFVALERDRVQEPLADSLCLAHADPRLDVRHLRRHLSRQEPLQPRADRERYQRGGGESIPSSRTFSAILLTHVPSLAVGRSRLRALRCSRVRAASHHDPDRQLCVLSPRPRAPCSELTGSSPSADTYYVRPSSLSISLDLSRTSADSIDHAPCSTAASASTLPPSALLKALSLMVSHSLRRYDFLNFRKGSLANGGAAFYTNRAVITAYSVRPRSPRPSSTRPSQAAHLAPTPLAVLRHTDRLARQLVHRRRLCRRPDHPLLGDGQRARASRTFSRSGLLAFRAACRLTSLPRRGYINKEMWPPLSWTNTVRAVRCSSSPALEPNLLRGGARWFLLTPFSLCRSSASTTSSTSSWTARTASGTVSPRRRSLTSAAP